jgi:hypothetical protein
MANPSFKTCKEGHFYPSSNDQCPYCKKSNNDTSSENTVKIPSLNEEKTEMIEEKTNTPVGINEGDKTIIFSGDNATENKPQTNIRRLVGWLVSYTLNENGIDFRLYEGKNTVGRAMESNIRISQDKMLSSLHATILYRGDSIYFKDEMSSNPSFVNEEEVMPGDTAKLKDGDVLKIGENTYLLRMSNFIK